MEGKQSVRKEEENEEVGRDGRKNMFRTMSGRENMGGGEARDKRQSAEGVGRQERAPLAGSKMETEKVESVLGGGRQGQNCGGEERRRKRQRKHERGRERRGTRENLLREWGNRMPAGAKNVGMVKVEPNLRAGGRGRTV
jgi:hypothetical protein